MAKITIKQPITISHQVRGNVAAILIPQSLLDRETDYYFFLDIRDLKRKNLDLKFLAHDRDLKRYLYIENIDDIINTPTFEDRFWEILGQHCQKNSLLLLSSPDFDSKNLYFFQGIDQLFYPFGSNMPISPLYKLDYTAWVDNEHYDLDIAENSLKKSPWVTNLERINIPWYNQEEHRTEALEFFVRLPQELFETLVNYFRVDKKDPNWSLRVRDCLTHSYLLEPFDVLGLLKARKPSKRES